jgi:hypothetical protein
MRREQIGTGGKDILHICINQVGFLLASFFSSMFLWPFTGFHSLVFRFDTC